MSCEASCWHGRGGEAGAQLVSALRPSSTVCHPEGQTGICACLCLLLWETLLPGTRPRRVPPQHLSPAGAQRLLTGA